MKERRKQLCLNKLIDATDICGSADGTVFEIVQNIYKALSPLPEFIGVAPFGSSTKGYFDRSAGSDFDMYIFEDKTLRDGGDRLLEELHPVLLPYMKKGTPVQIVEQFFNEENIRNLMGMIDSVPHNYFYLTCFANLCRPMRGEKAAYWRNVIKEELAHQPRANQEKFILLIVNSLVNAERISFPKMSERIDGFDSEAYLLSRRILWTRRVEKLYLG